MPDTPTSLFRRRSFLTILLMLGAYIPFIHGAEPDLLPPEPQASSPSPASGLGYMDAAVLGVVEGLTEYLPVSSTGHLILADQILLSSGHPNLDPGFQTARNAYLIAIQGGAILAVIILYWRRIQSILKGCLGLDPGGMRLGIRILLAFVPSAALGLMIQDWMEAHLFHPPAVALSLIVGAFLMLWVEWKNRAKNDTSTIENPNGLENLSKRQAIVIGCFQCLALWPGMSRSMSTIVGAYWVAPNRCRRRVQFPARTAHPFSGIHLEPHPGEGSRLHPSHPGPGYCRNNHRNGSRHASRPLVCILSLPPRTGLVCALSDHRRGGSAGLCLPLIEHFIPCFSFSRIDGITLDAVIGMTMVDLFLQRNPRQEGVDYGTTKEKTVKTEKPEAPWR